MSMQMSEFIDELKAYRSRLDAAIAFIEVIDDGTDALDRKYGRDRQWSSAQRSKYRSTIKKRRAKAA